MPMENVLKNTVLALLRPLVRYLIGQGWTYPALCELLKTVYVAEAEQHYNDAPAKAITDSRISLLTGIHRKDVKRLRGELARGNTAPALRKGANLAARVVASWISSPDYQDEQGAPKVLPFRAEGDDACFENLVRELKADLRAKAILDELLRVGVVSVDYNDHVKLLRTAYVSSLPEDKLAFLGANVGDHLQSALYNLDHPANPLLERAVYYDALPAELLAEARPELYHLGDRMLRQANRLLMAKDEIPAEGKTARRMRLGVYYYEEDSSGDAP